MMASNNGELYWSFRKFARGPNSSRKAHHGSMLNKANRVTLGYLPLYHHWLWLPNSSTGWYRPIKTSSMVIVGFSGEFLLFLKPPSFSWVPWDAGQSKHDRQLCSRLLLVKGFGLKSSRRSGMGIRSLLRDPQYFPPIWECKMMSWFSKNC